LSIFSLVRQTPYSETLAARFIMGRNRVLIFIWAGQFLNERADKKFYFDKDDKTFFTLYLWDNEYRVFHKTPSNLTNELEQNLLAKIEKVKMNATSIIEIQKVDKKFDYSPSIPAKDVQELKLKMKMEKEMAQYAFRFLEDNNIDLDTTDVIELY
jgi:hypothetical protein